MRNARTQYYVRSGDDAAGTALHVAGRSRDDDEIIATLHPGKLFPHFFHDIWFGQPSAPGAARKHIEWAVPADGRRNDRLRPGSVSRDDSRKPRIRPDPQHACHTTG